jgi:hypothetical protein
MFLHHSEQSRAGMVEPGNNRNKQDMDFTCTLQLGILCVPVKFPFVVFRHWFQTQFWSKSSLPAAAKQHGRGAA